MGFDAAGDEGDFVFEEGVIVMVVDADGAAEDYEQVAGVGLRQGEAGLGGVEVFNLEVSGAEGGFKGSQVFKGYVA